MSEKVLIDRKLLADLLSQDRETRINAERSLYAQLANTTIPQPAAVEAVEVRGLQWLDTGHYRKKPPKYGYNPHDWNELMTVAQHNRIMAATVPAGCKVVNVELLEDLCDLASDAVEHHREAFAGYKIERQANMDETIKAGRAILEVKDERG